MHRIEGWVSRPAAADPRSDSAHRTHVQNDTKERGERAYIGAYVLGSLDAWHAGTGAASLEERAAPPNGQLSKRIAVPGPRP
jgi:hypothetical protein